MVIILKITNALSLRPLLLQLNNLNEVLVCSGKIVVNQTSLEEIEAFKNLLSGSGYSRNGTLLVRGYGKLRIAQR